jgi:hypothetical protein
MFTALCRTPFTISFCAILPRLRNLWCSDLLSSKRFQLISKRFSCESILNLSRPFVLNHDRWRRNYRIFHSKTLVLLLSYNIASVYPTNMEAGTVDAQVTVCGGEKFPMTRPSMHNREHELQRHVQLSTNFHYTQWSFTEIKFRAQSIQLKSYNTMITDQLEILVRTAYLPWHDTDRTENNASNNYGLVICVVVAALTFLSSRYLGTTGGCLPSRFLATIAVTYTLIHITVVVIVFALYSLWPPLWSSGQSFWLLTQGSRVRFLTLPDVSEQQWVWTGVHSASWTIWGATWKK